MRKGLTSLAIEMMNDNLAGIRGSLQHSLTVSKDLVVTLVSFLVYFFTSSKISNALSATGAFSVHLTKKEEEEKKKKKHHR